MKSACVGVLSIIICNTICGNKT